MFFWPEWWDPQADRPVYQQLADLLRSAISSGGLRPGAQLPSEHELVAEHGVSRGTARQAIMLLRNEGLIDVVHGLGSFVREPEPVVRLGPDRLSPGWDPDDHQITNRPTTSSARSGCRLMSARCDLTPRSPTRSAPFQRSHTR